MFYSSVTLNVRLPDFDIHAINTSVITLATVQTLATLHGSFDTSLTVITTLAAMFTILTHDSEGTQRDSQLIRLDRPRNEHMPPSTTQQLRNERTPSGAITHFTRSVSHFGLFSRSETVIRHSPLTPSIAISADFHGRICVHFNHRSRQYIFFDGSIKHQKSLNILYIHAKCFT